MCWLKMQIGKGEEMTLLTVEGLNKSYGEKTLFSGVSFSISDGDKIGVIGINGTGKTTLLKIVQGSVSADEGTIFRKSDLTVELLDQEPDFHPEATVLEQIFKGSTKAIQVVRAYEDILEKLESAPEDKALQTELSKLSEEMTALDAWEIESKAKTILTKLGIRDYHMQMKTLSGGQRKRVALAAALIAPCDLLILDEPTNHMDNDTINWLEEFLESRRGALLMITHDRYFLDRVVNKTLELDSGSMFTYQGNYSYFVEKRIERRQMDNIIERKRLNLYKRELAWMRAGVQARGTKAKARIQRFKQIEQDKISLDAESLDMPLGQSRLGKKVIELKQIGMSYGERQLIKDFTYTLLRNDRIGVIGDNGIGKSTLLKIIAGKIAENTGSIDVGSTVKIGFFEQGVDDLDESLRAIDYIKLHAEFIETESGYKISASQMMERFLFNSDLQWSYISTLSGGEKRRLYLLRVLMEAPNVLLLDEPTNDLDIDTLKVLETYIDEFDGAVISVSHDRYFLDRTCDRIFAFTGAGEILEHTGNYSDYIEFKASVSESPSVSESKVTVKNVEKPRQMKLKFTYQEEREFNSIEREIESLEAELERIEVEMQRSAHDFVKLNDLMKAKDTAEDELLIKMERFEYLTELDEKIKNQ